MYNVLCSFCELLSHCCSFSFDRILLSTHADRQGVDISVTVCVFFVCTIMDFCTEDKVSGVKFYRAVHRFQGSESPIFALPRSPKSDESASALPSLPAHIGRAHGPCV